MAFSVGIYFISAFKRAAGIEHFKIRCNAFHWGQGGALGTASVFGGHSIARGGSCVASTVSSGRKRAIAAAGAGNYLCEASASMVSGTIYRSFCGRGSGDGCGSPAARTGSATLSA